jgi:polyhydroxybutyrate depolymerase
MSKLLGELLLATALVVIGAIVYFMVQGPEYSGAFLAQARENRFKPLAGLLPAAGQGGPLAASSDEAEERGHKDAEHHLEYDGRRRRYLVHVPKGYDGQKPLPVVLAFHGGMGRAESVRTQSRLNEAADKFGFLAVYPDGTGLTRLLTYNAGACCGYAVRKRVDDVGFVRRLITDDLPAHYRTIDRRRVYATGISNGAMLCYRLACEMPELIAAIAPVAGDMVVEGPRPKRPVPVIHFHGLKDNNVPYAGGVGRNAVQPVRYRPVEEVIAWWAQVNGCGKKSAEVLKEADATRTTYEPPAGAAGAPVVLYALPEGGHNWPGGVDTTGHLGTGPHVTTVDATTLMWQFFAQHPLPEKPRK